MTILTQLYHKKNELFEVEFYQDKECTQYTKKTIIDEDIYIELQNGDISPLAKLEMCLASGCNIYTPFISTDMESTKGNRFITIDDITPNLSKYIPKDNAVLFLSADCCEKYMKCFEKNHFGLYANDGLDKVTLEGSINAINEFIKNPIKKLTIFLPHGTQSELQKANEVAKELKEKYGVEEVNLLVLHCFINQDYIDGYVDDIEYHKDGKFKAARIKLSQVRFDLINKIITTNSTGILPVQDTERLQVIDCKEIFEEYLKESN